MVARSIIGYEFTPSYGILHDSQTNAFNLADDFIEVLRPFVDVIIAKYVTEDTNWSAGIGGKLFGVLGIEATWNNEKLSITHGVDNMIKGFVTSCRQRDANPLSLACLLISAFYSGSQTIGIVPIYYTIDVAYRLYYTRNIIVLSVFS